ncbi:hypothetical protein HK097_003256 [Rhizophlyctis rosea]|uniref:Uncharacterized protein n=1 Tax=Rhizophlyctis rosea TaxID=64517 RepID=A0AAD5SG15_9FUNG|nr:hypothetical protein HK097_003256 [Rhizophlyctis rosea]
MSETAANLSNSSIEPSYPSPTNPYPSPIPINPSFTQTSNPPTAPSPAHVAIHIPDQQPRRFSTASGVGDTPEDADTPAGRTSRVRLVSQESLLGFGSFGIRDRVRHLLENERYKDYLRKGKERAVLWKNRRDVIMFGLSLLYLIICAYCTYLSNSYADRVNTNAHLAPDEKYVAPDVLLDATYPAYASNHWIPRDIADILVRICLILMIVRAITLGTASCTVLRRIAIILGSLYLFRAPLVSLTVLPSPWRECVAQYEENMGLDALVMLAQMRAACGDVFYRYVGIS